MKEGGTGRSESEREKAKMRERQRRAMKNKILDGLRKHGGYRLSPRADANEILRELAREAGWVVEPDGTTYRSPIGLNCCAVCGAVKSSRGTNTTPTPTSSLVMGGGGGGGGGGDCSTTTSPHRVPAATRDSFPSSMSGEMLAGLGGDIPQAFHFHNGLTVSGSQVVSSTLAAIAAVGGGGGHGVVKRVVYQQQQQRQQGYALQEVRASNTTTPVVSPPHQAN